MTANSSTNASVAQLGRSLKEKEAEIELLQQTFTEIGSELDLDRVFQIVSERARDLINAGTVLIPLLDDSCDTYTYRGGAGDNAEEAVGESLPIDFGICGWVWEHKKPWWRGVLEEFDDLERASWEGRAGTTILVPLQGRTRFLGGISGINKIGGGDFTRRDLNLLQLFASIVSIAIENAMAVNSMEASHKLNREYQSRLEIMNKQLIESSKELEYLSLYDTVTSLPNRSLFHDRLAQNIDRASHSDSQISILLVGLDRFKEINETLGHENGDLLLRKIAEVFGKHVTPSETLARLGGDEFAIILPRHDIDSTVQRAKLFRKLLDVPFSIEHTDVAVSVSIGAAVFPDHGDSASTLLSHADSAMYLAKNSNRGVCSYDPEQDHSSRSRLSMLADIRRALEEEKFDLHYQPKISISTNKIISAEALGRWTSDTRGDVSPAIFIQALEQNGLIDAYTYWAIKAALKQAKAWDRGDSQFRVAVNISPQTLMHPDFISNLEQIVENKDSGRHLIFEITENLFLSEYDRLLEVLEYICALGIQLSIDDYGTGYSSLNRLRRLPVSELKIDKSFIRYMSHNKDDVAIVRSTIDLAHNLGLAVVAEGVETQDALTLLQGLGCDTAQGYLISEPLAAEKFGKFMENY